MFRAGRSWCFPTLGSLGLPLSSQRSSLLALTRTLTVQLWAPRGRFTLVMLLSKLYSRTHVSFSGLTPQKDSPFSCHTREIIHPSS